MFDVDENGDLIYSPDADATPLPDIQDGSLFDSQDTSPAPQGEGTDYSSDDLSEEIPPADDFTPDASPVPVTAPFDVSGGDLSLTTSGDIYIYPDFPADPYALEDRSATSATVTGLPNSSSLQYLEDVARGYPSWYKYMAFKTDASYSQSMVLYIGSAGKKDASRNRIDFTNVDRIEINYVRSGSSYYYQYQKYHYDSYQIPYNTDVFLYTNAVDGYAEFDLQKPYSVSGLLFLALAIVVIGFIFRGGGKR